MSLGDQLRALGLRHVGAHLDDIIDQATKKRWSPAQLLEHLADQESQDRSRRSVERRLNRSRVGRFPARGRGPRGGASPSRARAPRPQATFPGIWPT